MEKGIEREHVLEMVDYMLSDENRQKTKENLINQILGFLNHKYPSSSISWNLEEDTFRIEGNDVEDILNDLKSMAVL